MAVDRQEKAKQRKEASQGKGESVVVFITPFSSFRGPLAKGWILLSFCDEVTLPHLAYSIRSRGAWVLFSYKNFYKMGTVAFSFVFDKYCPIMD